MADHRDTRVGGWSRLVDGHVWYLRCVGTGPCGSVSVGIVFLVAVLEGRGGLVWYSSSVGRSESGSVSVSSRFVTILGERGGLVW